MRGIILGIGAAGLIWSIIYLVVTVGYSRGTMASPGPGLYPLFIGVFLFVASAGTVLGIRSKAAQGQVDWPRGRGLWRVVSITAAGVMYVVLLPYSGHGIAAVVVTLIALQAMGGLGWPLKIGLTIAIALGSYYLFNVLLNVPLPRGIWFG